LHLTYQAKLADPYSSHALILNKAGEGHGRRLLDVGSAQGVLAEQFTQRGFEVTCIEGDPNLAALGKDKCHEMIVVDLDKQLPLLKGQYDVIVYGDILEHLKNPMGVFKGFNEYLKREGTIILSIPNIAHLWVRLNILFGRFEYRERGVLDRTHLRFFTLASFERFVEEAGLAIEYLASTPAPLMLMVPSRYHGHCLNALHRVNAALAHSWKSMFGFQFVAVARPRTSV
jgi:2-polyprenyl-3-methyl-5-hydroxy-6-metoxy-1,4-benzoquinol methylase